MADRECKISQKTKTSLERWHCRAAGSGMDKNNIEQKVGGLWRRATSCSGRTQPRIEENRSGICGPVAHAQQTTDLRTMDTDIM